MSKSVMLAAVVLLLSIYTCVTVTDISSIPHCLECLCMVETNNSDCSVDTTYTESFYSIQKRVKRSHGPLNLNVLYYKDCGSPGFDGKEAIEVPYQRCANDPECTKSCVQKYTSKYLDKCNIKRSLCERYVRIHFGGPGGCSPRQTDQKWLAVETCMNSTKTS